MRSTADPTLEDLAQRALAMATRHRPRTDAELIGAVSALAESDRQRYLRWTAGVVAVALVLLGIFETIPTPTHLPSDQATPLVWMLRGLTVGLSGLVWWSFRRDHVRAAGRFRSAREALARQEYDHRDVGLTFGIWHGSLVPLKEGDWSWTTVSEKVAEHPVLARVWAEWLVGAAPIRDQEVSVLNDALSAERKAQEWRDRQASPQSLQETGRQAALDKLPADLLATLKGERLNAALPASIVPQPPKPRL